MCAPNNPNEDPVVDDELVVDPINPVQPSVNFNGEDVDNDISPGQIILESGTLDQVGTLESLNPSVPDSAVLPPIFGEAPIDGDIDQCWYHGSSFMRTIFVSRYDGTHSDCWIGIYELVHAIASVIILTVSMLVGIARIKQLARAINVFVILSTISIILRIITQQDMTGPESLLLLVHGSVIVAIQFLVGRVSRNIN
jgi:hypothetical protein